MFIALCYFPHDIEADARDPVWPDAMRRPAPASFAGLSSRRSTGSAWPPRQHREPSLRVFQRFLSEVSSVTLPEGRQPLDDIVHEIGRDEARHGKGFAGLLKWYF